MQIKSIVCALRSVAFLSAFGAHFVAQAQLHGVELQNGRLQARFYNSAKAVESFELCTPLRGRFVPQAVAAAGSTAFIVNSYGDMYSRSVVELGKRRLPVESWKPQPKIEGRISDAIRLITLPGAQGRELFLRVEGWDAQGRPGYYQKEVERASWSFVSMPGLQIAGRELDNRPADMSQHTLRASDERSYSLHKESRGQGSTRMRVTGLQPHCHLAELSIGFDESGVYAFPLYLSELPRRRNSAPGTVELQAMIEVTPAFWKSLDLEPRAHSLRQEFANMLGATNAWVPITVRVSDAELSFTLEDRDWVLRRD